MRYYSSKAEFLTVWEGMDLTTYSDKFNYLFGNRHGSPSYHGTEDLLKLMQYVCSEYPSLKELDYSSFVDWVQAFVTREGHKHPCMTPSEVQTITEWAHWCISWDIGLKDGSFVVCNINDGRTLSFTQGFLCG